MRTETNRPAPLPSICRDCGDELVGVGPPYRYGDLCRRCAEDRYREDGESCAACPADADVLDDGMVPLCARCWDAQRVEELARAERECGWRTDRDAASDWEVRS